jgi:hypothetical protein
MTKIRRISNSEISTFKECRRKWWLAWHRGLTPKHKPQVGALAIGSRVHEALAAVYAPDGRPLTELPTILHDLLEEDRRLLMNDPTQVFELARFDSEATLQRIMLEGYVAWVEETGADDGYEMISAEEFIEIGFVLFKQRDLQVNLIGRLDVRARRLVDGKIVFIDHKTAASITEVIKQLRMSPQMKMYRVLLSHPTRDDQPSSAVYSIMKKIKRTVRASPPFYERVTIDFNPRELATFTDQLRGVIDDIIAVEEGLAWGDQANTHLLVYPTPTRDCSWKCPFFTECTMFDDGSRVEDALADKFVVSNPLHYYGREDLVRHATGDS